MREHIYFHGGGTDNRQTTENAKVEASLNLRLAESGAKNQKTAAALKTSHLHALLQTSELLLWKSEKRSLKVSLFFPFNFLGRII